MQLVTKPSVNASELANTIRERNALTKSLCRINGMVVGVMIRFKQTLRNSQLVFGHDGNRT